MKSTQLNMAALIAGIVVVGAASAAAGACVGYGKGYRQGNFDGRHEASRSTVAIVSEMMTIGVAIKQPDGTAKTYLLQPVETAKN